MSACVPSMHCMASMWMCSMRMVVVAVCMPTMCMSCMTAHGSAGSHSHLLLLLLVLALYVLPDCIQVVTILLPATRAGVVVLVLQPLVAEQAHLVPTDRQQERDAALLGTQRSTCSAPTPRLCSKLAARHRQVVLSLC